MDAIFDPPPAMPFANDDAFPVRYAAHQGLPCRQLALHVEGGNLWSDGRGTLISTEGLFDRNPTLPRAEVRDAELHQRPHPSTVGSSCPPTAISDATALAVYREAMPDHEVVGIDASVAANAGGAVHCLTMQITADRTRRRL